VNRVWTEEEIEILRQDRAARIPIPVTAAKLGRPVPATYARARLIGTLVQPHQPWDEAGVARMRELVSADPPMTDKSIAAELGRTVTQIRWKMQDLGLIGVRDLSKLAKITASRTGQSRPARPVAAKPVAAADAAPGPAPAAAARPAHREAPVQDPQHEAPDPRKAVTQAVERLEVRLAQKLKGSIAASEAGMIQAAKDAIAEKGRIDRRLAELADKPVSGSDAEKTPAQAVRKADGRARQPKQDPKPQDRKRPDAPRPVARKTVTPAIQGASQGAAPRPVAAPTPPPAPKIVVMEAPAAARPPEPDPAQAQVSGRGGWKSVRRDPARIMAQAKSGKAANRADAEDLAQAAQAAISRFIAERGVTRMEIDGVQSLVSRLQARGYIVVREGDGWVIDQRHRLADEAELVSFAEARGITLSKAA